MNDNYDISASFNWLPEFVKRTKKATTYSTEISSYKNLQKWPADIRASKLQRFYEENFKVIEEIDYEAFSKPHNKYVNIYLNDDKRTVRYDVSDEITSIVTLAYDPSLHSYRGAKGLFFKGAPKDMVDFAEMYMSIDAIRKALDKRWLLFLDLLTEND